MTTRMALTRSPTSLTKLAAIRLALSMVEMISRPPPIGSGHLQLGMPASVWPQVSVRLLSLLLFVLGVKLPSEHGTVDVMGVEDMFGDLCSLAAFTEGVFVKIRKCPACG